MSEPVERAFIAALYRKPIAAELALAELRASGFLDLEIVESVSDIAALTSRFIVLGFSGSDARYLVTHLACGATLVAADAAHDRSGAIEIMLRYGGDVVGAVSAALRFSQAAPFDIPHSSLFE